MDGTGFVYVLPKGLAPDCGTSTRKTMSGNNSFPSALPLPDLGSKYEVEGVIGRGGMGTVFSVRHRAMGEPRAVKILRFEDGVLDEDRFERFRREAVVASSLEHRSIIRVFDFDFAPDGSPFIVMERLEGEDLESLWRRRGRLPLEEVLGLLEGPAEALDEAHLAGIVHRDLKPGNLFLTAGGAVKILDFGISHVESREASLTRTGEVIGTPAYMPPEQLNGERVDGRADIYSFTAVAYTLLCGRLPYEYSNVAELVTKILLEDPARATAIVTGIPARVGEALSKGMAKEPGRRFGKARDLMLALAGSEAALERARRISIRPSGAEREAVSGGGPAATRPSWHGKTLPSPSTRRRSHRRIAAAAVLTAIALAAGGAAWMARKGGPAPAPGSGTGATLLSRSGATLACPLFEAVGVEEPSGWMGAAASHMACDRAAVAMGGLPERTLVPAQLLDLPKELVDDFPDDPFCEEGARERSVEAARARGTAWLDGRVEVRKDEFVVRLRVLSAEGRELGSARGAGPALYRAVGGALDDLTRQGAIPGPELQDPRAARWSGVRDTSLALELNDFENAMEARTGLAEIVARLESRRAELGPSWWRIHWGASRNLGRVLDPAAKPTLDGSSPERLALTAQGADDKVAVADELAAFRRLERDPLGRSALAKIEMELRYQGGDFDRLRQVAVASILEDPRGDGWGMAASASLRQKGSESALRGAAAWYPDSADAWNSKNYSDRENEPDVRLGNVYRAYTLAPEMPLRCLQYVGMLLLQGFPERARAVASRLSDGDEDQRAASDSILSAIEGSYGRLEAAMDRSLSALLDLDSFGRIEAADLELFRTAMGAAEILGRSSEVGDAMARRFVLAEPSRMDPGHYALLYSSRACALASPEVTVNCFARLRDLADAGAFIEGQALGTEEHFAANERFSRRDYAGAVAAWRPLLAVSSYLPSFASVAFDAAGEAELASRVDEKEMENAPLFNGATMAHVREAKRAFDRKDFERARSLARTVIDAWGAADAPVPSVAQMRELLAELPGGDA